MDSYWSFQPLLVLWVTITLPCTADEEVRKYSGHCRAKIRLRAWPPVPKVRAHTELPLVECLHA